MKKSLYYIQFAYGKHCETSKLVWCYSRDNAASLIREYYEIPHENIVLIREATKEDINAMKHDYAMVYCYVALPIEQLLRK